jgi:hypothetical protein
MCLILSMIMARSVAYELGQAIFEIWSTSLTKHCILIVYIAFVKLFKNNLHNENFLFECIWHRNKVQRPKVVYGDPLRWIEHVNMRFYNTLFHEGDDGVWAFAW